MHSIETHTRVYLIGALVCCLVLPAAARADDSMVMLPLQGQSSIKTLDAEILEAIKGLGRKIGPSSLGLDDMMMAVGCTTLNETCLQMMGQSIKAPGLIIGKISQRGDTVRLQLRWFDVVKGEEAGTTNILLPVDPMVRKPILRGAVRSLMGIKAAPMPIKATTGGLSITANQPYVEISINGQPRGALPLELRDLEPGTYTIMARLDGYLGWQGEVLVSADRMTNVNIEMIPSPKGKKAPTFFDAVRWPTWLVAGVGVAAIGGGIAFGANMWATQNEIDSIQGDTLEEMRRMESLREDGERDALAANILFGVGTGAMLTAGFMAYWDYRNNRPDVATKEAPGKTAPAPATSVILGPGSIQIRGSF